MTQTDARVVLKYPLHPATGGQHAIPKGSRFLALQVQNDQPVMWWSVPADAGSPQDWPLRTFTIVPTGPPGYLDKFWYVGTFQLGGFVGHVHSWEPFEKS
jgi:hypothetical protein